MQYVLIGEISNFMEAEMTLLFCIWDDANAAYKRSQKWIVIKDKSV